MRKLCPPMIKFSRWLSISTSPSTKKQLVKFSHDPQSKVGIITLDSPVKHNPLTVEIGHQFKETIAYINSSISANKINVNSILLHGANSTFSAGGDIKWLKELKKNPVHVNADHMLDFYRSFLCVRDLQVPVISVIDGYAIGAGACLALATDLRVVSADAKISFNFVKLGIHAGMGGSHFLPLAVGEGRAMDILLTGRVLTGIEAGEMGVAQRVVHKSGLSLLEEAKMIAIEIGSNSPLAVRSMVQTLKMRENALGGGLESALRREAFAQALCYAKSDWGEGLDAIVERRQPSFDDYSSSNDDWV
jgi:enoyl-CoA hydratase/carnithine racemase